MEEIDYKKKYNEALERAKEIKSKILYSHLSTESCKAVSEYIDTIVPELRESEDERIRKEIIDYLGLVGKGDGDYAQPMIDRWIAYLEKQKEPHYTKRNALFDMCVENCNLKTVEEVNKRVDDIMNMSELSAFEQALTNFIGYWEDDEERWPSKFVKKHGKHILDMAREELQKEHKSAEWKPQPESLEALMYAIEGEWDKIKPTSYLSRRLEDLYEGLVNTYNVDESLLTKLPKTAYTAKDIEEFRVLKEKIEASMESPVDKPAEWSEEDEQMRRNLMSLLANMRGDRITEETYKKYYPWLKSLRPQPSWKPSDK